MSSNKQLWLLAGGNGAGKSTFYQSRLTSLGIPFINADVIAKELHPEAPERFSYEGAKLAEQMRLRLLQEGRSFCFETVFSHSSKIDFVARAKALGYQVILVFIHLDNSALNKARVSQRVSEGGHHVPEDKVDSRIPRLLENIKVVIPLCDHVRILDNSRADNPFQQLVTIRNGEIEIDCLDLPGWLDEMLSPRKP